jgi:hypothetical protein
MFTKNGDSYSRLCSLVRLNFLEIPIFTKDPAVGFVAW